MMHGQAIYQQVARIHADNIDQGFLSSLGVSFLALLYEAIDADDQSVLLVTEQDGRVTGFVAGAEGMRSIYRQLLFRWPRLVMAMLPTIVSPHKLLKIGEILLLGRKAKPLHGIPHQELLSIAVCSDIRGRGQATTLYQRLVEHFRRQGAQGFRIVVGDSLQAAHHFYKKMGAVPEGRIEVHKGQGSVVYVQRWES